MKHRTESKPSWLRQIARRRLLQIAEQERKERDARPAVEDDQGDAAQQEEESATALGPQPVLPIAARLRVTRVQGLDQSDATS